MAESKLKLRCVVEVLGVNPFSLMISKAILHARNIAVREYDLGSTITDFATIVYAVVNVLKETNFELYPMY